MSVLDCIVIRKSVSDTLAWTFCANGMFSVKSFRRGLEDPLIESCSYHSLIWQGICPPKIEIFVWQLLRGRVIVRKVLQEFGYGPTPSLLCPICNEGEETIDHLFLLCPWSWKLWKYCMDWWEVVSYMNNSLKNWFLGWSGLSISAKERRAWNTLFFTTTWTIREARNQMVFNGKSTDFSQAADTVKFRVAWWFKQHERGSKLPISMMLLDIKVSCVETNHVKSTKSSEWVPPTGDTLKFNVDGSSRGNPRNTGIERVLRDKAGKLWGLFSGFVGILESNAAELFAIHRAVSLCIQSQVLIGKEIDIVGDSKVAVLWVNSEGIGNLKHVDIILDIRNMLCFLGNTRVIFNSRDSNSFADSLAKKKGLPLRGIN
ncbi:hypothetical protein Dsin_014386 [Dipteronia sinensis]|uniref:Reverse transcriptase zinc-binding domain-containing protein n=1 Tax=Dipteronia sinensis TaxID=43782 RepID=A0AAE0E9W1_9ROSI|nr:hypothetical protein Dsin_014386 [Dipteronia sinensis]